METGVDAPNLDSVYGLLSESRRRYALYCLLNAEQTTVEDLALEIVAWEQDSDIESVSEAETEPVIVSLHHTHLPRLEDHGIITYDGGGGDIGIGSNFGTIRSTVERARDVEGTGLTTGAADTSFSYREPVTEYANTE